MKMRRELTEIGKAYLRAMAAKNISRQMRKFWYPAATVPDCDGNSYDQ